MDESYRCQCDRDQYCPRFRREMSGRFRDICAGIDVDVGTAAAFREQWAREAEPAPSTTSTPAHLLLRTDQMPGDAVAMTAAVYSLHQSHPGRYATAVESKWPEVFEYNPHVSPLDSLSDPRLLHMHYPAIHRCNERGVHFMQAWCEHLSNALCVSVPLLTDRPRLYFPEGEPPPVGNFWLVCSGGKRDFTTKLWGHHNYQAVVSYLKGSVRFVQVGASEDEHPPLDGLHKYMVGKTSLRRLFDLVRRARGVLCGVSLLMHVAAALDKPAIVLAGGREPVTWNSYPKQHYLHTVGALPCRSVQGHVGRACWRSRTVPLGDGSYYDRNTCERPVGDFPQCMTLISPEEVASLVLRYNDYQ